MHLGKGEGNVLLNVPPRVLVKSPPTLDENRDLRHNTGP